MPYKIIIEADPQEGGSISEARENLCQLFKTHFGSGEKFFTGQPVIVKTGLDFTQAEKYRQAIIQTGARCRIVQERKASSTEEQAGVRCPNCGYTSKTDNDLLITGAGGLGECPSCGIIVKKFLLRQSAQSEDAFVAPPAHQTDLEEFAVSTSTEKTEFMKKDSATPLASTHRRRMAGLYTLTCGVMLWLIIIIPATIIHGWSTRGQLYDLPKAQVNRVLSLHNDNTIVLMGVIAIFVFIHALVTVPLRRRQTWGQSQFNLWIIDHKGNKTVSQRILWRRILGQVLTPISLIGGGVLTQRIVPKGSLPADSLSETTLMMESGEDPEFGKVVIAITLCLIVLFFSNNLMVGNWVEAAWKPKPPPPPKTTEEIKQLRQQQNNRQEAIEKMTFRMLEKRCQNGDLEACRTLEDITPSK